MKRRGLQRPNPLHSYGRKFPAISECQARRILSTALNSLGGAHSLLDYLRVVDVVFAQATRRFIVKLTMSLNTFTMANDSNDQWSMNCVFLLNTESRDFYAQNSKQTRPKPRVFVTLCNELSPPARGISVSRFQEKPSESLY